MQAQRPHHDILKLFKDAKLRTGFLPISAPMVRYSKFEFRQLLRMNDVKLTFTPMIIADSFNRSQKARENEFTTTADDAPLIAQFAACSSNEFSTAAEFIYPYVDGVDLNCGCPQSWAIQKQYGCGLLRKPEIMRDIINTTRRRLPANFSISIKFRIISGGVDGEKKETSCMRATVELARQLEHCGATFVTLHGRTVRQTVSDAVNVAVIAAVKDALNIPLIANGDVHSWQDACDLFEYTKADGIMAARGLLTNPTLFNEKCRKHKTTCLECVQQWLNIAACAGDNLQFQCFHHHLTFMWHTNLKRSERIQFNQFTKKQQVLDFFEMNYNIKPAYDQINPYMYHKCTYTTNSPIAGDFVEKYHESTQGKFFKEFTTPTNTVQKEDDEQEYGLEDSFFLNAFI